MFTLLGELESAKVVATMMVFDDFWKEKHHRRLGDYDGFELWMFLKEKKTSDLWGFLEREAVGIVFK